MLLHIFVDVLVALPVLGVGNNTSKTDVAPWCYKWDWDGYGWMDGSPGGVKYRAP